VVSWTLASANSASIESGSRETASWAAAIAAAGLLATSASASSRASSERWGCHCVHAISSAPITIAAARPIRAGPGLPIAARNPRAEDGSPPLTLAPAGAGASAAESGPRPASQPAHSSAASATPGTYQVQSTVEWTPNSTTMQSMLSMPMRSGA